MAEGDLDDPKDYGSTVKNNLMKRPGYAPYCGDGKCLLGMPRTRFDGEQFVCTCGFRTNHDAEFIADFKARWPQR